MSKELVSVNPATGETVRSYTAHTDDEVNERLDAAVAAQTAWAATTFTERSGVLQRVAKLLEQEQSSLAELATTEMGKLPAEAEGEVDKCAWVCRYYAEKAAAFLADAPLEDDADKQSFISYTPLGVVLAVMPWNFPFWQVFRCGAPALMAGNALLLKHASSVSGCALAIEALFEKAGAPAGLFSSLLISGERASALLEDPRISAASVTGSEKAGGAVAAVAGGRIKPTVLELGGSDPFVVLDMADPETIIENAVTSRFMNCGQSCIAAKRFIVLETAFDAFVTAFRSAAQHLRPRQNLAPMAREDLRDTLQEQVDDARSHGARILMGGQPEKGDGYFYPPTLITDLSAECRLASEEAFGPVALLYRAADEDEAVRISNESPYGLGGSVWCGDADRALAVARRVESGAVYVNRMMASDPRLPFGGIKRSGYGRELAREGILEFVNRKTISIQR